MKIINKFDGENRFLSNFAPCKILWEGIEYPSTEHAYQAAKTLRVDLRKQLFTDCTPSQAKKNGRMIIIREDWDEVKIDVMRELLAVKFAIPLYQEKLLATEDAELIEGNWWGDVFWGVCNGKGKNHLGMLLMQQRRLLNKNS